MNGPTLAAGATQFDRIDEQMLQAAAAGQARVDQLCDTLDTLPGMDGLRPLYCTWRDRNLGRQTTKQVTKPGGCGCGDKCDQAARLARAEQAQRELAELLVRLLLPSVIADLQGPGLAVGPPTGTVPAHTW